MALPTLTLQRYAGELGRALQTVRDWSEGLRAEVMPRLYRQRGGDATTAIEHAKPGEMRVTGAGTVVLPTPAEVNRGFIVTLTAESTCTVRTVSGTVAGTSTVTVNSGRDALFVSDGDSAWQAWVRIKNSDDVVNVSTVTGDTVTEALDALAAAGVTDHGDLTGLDADDHTQYLLADGTRDASYLHSISYFSTGTNPASTGSIRCQNGSAWGMWQRNAANSANVNVASLNGSDIVDVGDATNAVSVRSRAIASHTWYTGGTQRAGLSAEEYWVRLDEVTEPAARFPTTNGVYFFRSSGVLCMGTYYGRSTVAPMRVA